jgi:hypothetical protein
LSAIDAESATSSSMFSDCAVRLLTKSVWSSEISSSDFSAVL